MVFGTERYESLRYVGKAYEFTHPDRLAAIARVHGLAAPDVETARVLELGCGDGMNLLAMAYTLPRARFVAIDACAAPLEVSRRAAVELGVHNLELRAQDIESIVPSHESFDYVIAHGVISWVPDATKRALMRLIGRVLSPEGVAMVSHNTLPGWRFRLIARDVIRAVLGESPRPDQLGEARRAVRTFADNLAGAGLYGAVMDELATLVEGSIDMSIYHDILSPNLDPMDFRTFAALYDEAGLQYVGDAVWADSVWSGYPPAFRALLEPVRERAVEREQLVDVMRNSLFRRSVLCRAQRRIVWDPGFAELRDLFVVLAGRFAGGGRDADTYRTFADEPILVSDPAAQRALAIVRDEAPRAVSMATLVERIGAESEAARDALARLVLQAWAGTLVELLPRARPAVAAPGPRPESFGVARWQARSGAESVINTCHEQIGIGPVDRALLEVCDGRKSPEEVVDALVALAATGAFRVVVDEVPTTDPALQRVAIAARLERRLAELGSVGLLEIAHRDGAT